MKKNITKDDELLSSKNATAEKGMKNSESKKKRFGALRASLVCLGVFTVLCGIIYPLSVTLISQAAFPYESNGSQIIVTLKDGSRVSYGSELIGQAYEDPKYMFGRVNTGAPSNLSPESPEYKNLLNERIAERKNKLTTVGYTDLTSIPSELITSGGSGVDPHISPSTAYFQIPAIVAARNYNITDSEEKMTAGEVEKVIAKYSEGRFLGVFGEKTVNVLLVNLSLDGLL